MTRTVHCAKLAQELPGLEKPPFPGTFGQRIFEQISHQAWAAWTAQEVNIINHYGLSLMDPEARDFLEAQMKYFLFDERPADAAHDDADAGAWEGITEGEAPR
ncbi:MAG: oxidative damage protection protein [Acidobacteriota bacterium]